MLASTIRRVWGSRPKLSLPFWIASTVLYAIGFFAIVALINPVVYQFLQAAQVPQIVAIKLNLIRLPLICLVLFAFPFLLWNSLEQALLLVKFVTALVIVFYIDDHLVLYELTGYPKSAIVKISLFLRPIAVMALLWITFELHFRVKIGQ